MPNLTIKNVPDALYDRLKSAAARSRRSINGEVIARLEQTLGGAAVDAETLLARARAVRERAGVPYLTDEAPREARDEGRA